ncbi:MAG TPA: hypothetical protein VIN09_11345 [Chloroflexota bacterium]
MASAEHNNPNANAVGIPTSGAGGLKHYTPHQLFFLARLSSLLRLRQEHLGTLDPNDWRMKLINKALYSTFCDCLEEGVGDEAKMLISQHRQQQN